MNINKAREYFSAHVEGTLDPGLQQAFERLLASDATVQAEYRAFVKAVEAINSMRDEEVEIPHNLHDHISARLDKHVWDQKQQNRGSWFGTWWRSLAVAGVASLAILATLVTVFNKNQGEGAATSEFIPTGSKKKAPALSVRIENGVLRLIVEANGARELIIRDLETQKPVTETIDLKKTPSVSAPLENKSAQPVILEVVPTGFASLRVALPGPAGAVAEGGTGTVAELAKGLASHFGCPVRISDGDLNQTVTWKYKGTELSSAPLTELDRGTIMIQQQDQMLTIVLTGVSK